MAGALVKGARITGAPRAELADELAGRYTAGESIRAIADDTGRSFGFVHGLIKESGADLRARGGATRGGAQPVPTAAPATKPATSAAGPGTATKSARTVRSAAAVPVSPTDGGTSGKNTAVGASAKKNAKKDSGKKDGGRKDSGSKDRAKKESVNRESAKKDGKKVKKR